jgi:hypothetical protein
MTIFEEVKEFLFCTPNIRISVKIWSNQKFPLQADITNFAQKSTIFDSISATLLKQCGSVQLSTYVI